MITTRPTDERGCWCLHFHTCVGHDSSHKEIGDKYANELVEMCGVSLAHKLGYKRQTEVWRQ